MIEFGEIFFLQRIPASCLTISFWILSTGLWIITDCVQCSLIDNNTQTELDVIYNICIYWDAIGWGDTAISKIVLKEGKAQNIKDKYIQKRKV